MRIIAGKFKGLTLYTFSDDNIRPTADKVRQAVFNIIQFEIKDSKFLDLFAGTGGVSLEAISRGANYVATVEKDKRSIRLINKNFNKAGAGCNLFSVDYKLAIKKFGEKESKFDFIYIDPPFNANFITTAINEICKYEILESSGTIIIEHDLSTKFDIPNALYIEKYKKYGNVAVTFLRMQ